MEQDTRRFKVQIIILALAAAGVIYWLIQRPTLSPPESPSISEAEILRRLTAPEGATNQNVDQEILRRLTAPQ